MLNLTTWRFNYQLFSFILKLYYHFQKIQN
jgi:hypothetical protein